MTMAAASVVPCIVHLKRLISFFPVFYSSFVPFPFNLAKRVAKNKVGICAAERKFQEINETKATLIVSQER